MVALDAVAGDGHPRRYPGGPSALVMPGFCLLQPRCGEYFPAVISRGDEQALHSQGQAVVTIALTRDEAKTRFVPGQNFTIWADGVVGQAISAAGAVGHGVISDLVTLPPPSAGSDVIYGRSAGPDGRRRMATAHPVAARAHDQRLAV